MHHKVTELLSHKMINIDSALNQSLKYAINGN